MGQYFAAVNRDKDEFVSPWSLGGLAKLWEWCANRQVGVLPYLLLGKDIAGEPSPSKFAGRWARSGVALVGDYDSSRLWDFTYSEAEVVGREADQRYPYQRPEGWRPFANVSHGLAREYNAAVGEPNGEPLTDRDLVYGDWQDVPLKRPKGAPSFRLWRAAGNRVGRCTQRLFLVNHTRRESVCPNCLGTAGTVRDWCRISPAGVVAYLLRKSDGGGGGDVDDRSLPFVGRWALDDVELTRWTEDLASYTNVSVPLASEYNPFVDWEELQVGASPCETSASRATVAV
jgi:hypothetical protein